MSGRFRPVRACAECRSERIAEAIEPEKVVLDGVTYGALVEAYRCDDCGEVYLDPLALERLEAFVIGRLRARAVIGPEALRYLRKHRHHFSR